MKKQIIASVTAAALCVGALAGCASGENSSSASSQAASSSAATQTAETTTPAEVAPVEQRDVYVTPAWLKSALAGDQEGYENLVVAEVVYEEAGLAKSYNQGHVPGATFVCDVDVEDAVGDEAQPYNLLSAEEVEANLLKRGITKDTKVVLYGSDAAGVGRVAWAYLWAGVEDVKILDGGIEAWKKAGFETETKKNEATPATAFGTAVPAHPEYLVSMDEAKQRLANDANFKLVSIRAEGEWLGETSGYSYIDRAGEPEGAVWGKGCSTAFDVEGFLNEDGTVKSLDDLKAYWSDSDFTLDNDLSFYCGTGWRATVPFLLLYQAGYDNISVYDGGWYQWQQHGENRVQVGDPATETVQHSTVAELPTDKAAQE